jgi:two-component system NtrC family sensor kinase
MATRILFVDDEPDPKRLIEQNYREQIDSEQVELDFAGNGREALDAIASHDGEYDLIITDLNMPQMNGLELLSELSKLELSTPVLVVSAYDDMVNIRSAMNRGAFDFLIKPIDFEDLAITQQRALAHLASLRERSRQPLSPPPPRGPMAMQNHLATIGLTIAGVAHDIRGPLSILLGFADLSTELAEEIVAEVKRRVEPAPTSPLVQSLEDLESNLGKIREHGLRVNKLIDTMLDTLRGNRALAQQTELNAVVSEHVDLFESGLRNANPSVELTLDKQLDNAVGLVLIAPQDISRIVLNLVTNAYEATRTKAFKLRDGGPPHIIVKTHRRGSAVELRVWDNGMGVPATLQQSIFDPFITTRGDDDGLGLGLAVTRELIEASGGSIVLYSEPGKFTEFVVTLPRAASR